MSAAAPRSHVILGISADFHDASAAIVIDGALVNAAQQERFSRIKHDPAVPIDAIRWCLDDADVGLSDLTHVVVYDKPLTSYERHLASHAAAGLRSLPSLARTLGAWSKSRLWLGYRVEKALRTLGVECPEIWYSEHHLSHAAAAFYPSPFDRAVIVTIDGVGEWATTTIASGAGHRIEQLVEQRFPHSMGLFYSAFTAFCGFEVNDGEYKLMGLAPYGEPRYVDRIYDRLADVDDLGGLVAEAVDAEDLEGLAETDTIGMCSRTCQGCHFKRNANRNICPKGTRNAGQAARRVSLPGRKLRTSANERSEYCCCASSRT